MKAGYARQGTLPDSLNTAIFSPLRRKEKQMPSSSYRKVSTLEQREFLKITSLVIGQRPNVGSRFQLQIQTERESTNTVREVPNSVLYI